MNFIKDVLKAFSLYYYAFCLIILACMFVNAIPAEAKITEDTTLFITHIDNSYMTWNYTSNVNITKASFDGVTIENFDADSLNYTAIDLPDSSYHTFCIYTLNEDNCESGNTTASSEKESEKFYGFINIYIFLILTLIALLISVWIKPVSWIALILSALGFLVGVKSSFLMALLFVILFVVSIASLKFD